METSFCELKGKEVINVTDGKRLGRIIDIVFDTKYGRLLGIVVPCYNKSWNIFKSGDDIFIPFGCICKFGDDAILVQIYIQNQSAPHGKRGRFIKTAGMQEPHENSPAEPQIAMSNIPPEAPNFSQSNNQQFNPYAQTQFNDIPNRE